MRALVGAFNQEKALVGAFSVIVQPVVEQMDRFAALPVLPLLLLTSCAGPKFICPWLELRWNTFLASAPRPASSSLASWARVWRITCTNTAVRSVQQSRKKAIVISAANRLIGEVVQSRRRPLLGPSPG